MEVFGGREREREGGEGAGLRETELSLMIELPDRSWWRQRRAHGVVAPTPYKHSSPSHFFLTV